MDWQEESLNLPDLVEKVRANAPEGLEQLYSVFERGIRFLLCRNLGPQDLDDKVHDTFLIVVEAIQRGELREPARLMGFVRTVVRRQIASSIDRAVQLRKKQAELEPGLVLPGDGDNPEEDLMARQRRELMLEVLRAVSQRDREILTRFYLRGETQEDICRNMHLSENQFRLLKSRAKARFGALGRRRLRSRLLPACSWKAASSWGD